MAGKLNILTRSFSVWLAIIAAETMNGAIREVIITPVVGGSVAKSISFGTAILLITAITFFCVRWISASNVAELISVGVLWALLTLVFEIAISRGVAGLSWNQVLADFNPFIGGLMSLGLIFLVFIPLISYRILATLGPGKLSS